MRIIGWHLFITFLDASKDKTAHPTAIALRGPNSQGFTI